MKTSMHPRHPSPLLLVLILSIFSTLSAAQSGGGLTGLPNLSSITQVAGATLTQTSAKAHSTSHPSSAKTTAATDKTSAADSSAQTTSSATFALTGAPSLTSSYVGLTGVPTLVGVGVPSLVIPNTANAPFMQKSNLPEGTIFICVGAALGFLGMSVLAWRGLVAWSLHRSVKRAAAAQYLTDKKVRYQVSGMYSTQNVSMDNLNTLNTSYAGAKAPKKTTSRQNTPNASLFFSPTAGSGVHSTTNRTSSAYLPAGYYASGASAPAAGSAIAHLGGGPTAAGYGRLSSSHSLVPSPPQSPTLHATERPADRSSYQAGRMGPSGTSRSSLNQHRAPSAYLDDLFENHGQGPRERF